MIGTLPSSARIRSLLRLATFRFRARPLVWTGLLLALSVTTGRPQVVIDGKLGPAGALAGPNYNITAGLGRVSGNNLFHSFAQFDLSAGDTATFSGPGNVHNILARVTGGSASSIDGTIRSDIPGANLFLINPHGVIFGPNATVDVSGSFAVSTADYLKLADGARFVASLDADDSGLSTAPVSAFGFLGSSAGAITIQQSTLAVQDHQSITLAGGDISLDGATVRSSGGQVNVVSVKSAGEVPVDPTTLSRAAFQTAFPQQGQISLQNEARLDASGEGGGRIAIRGGRLVVVNSRIESNNTGAGNGQGINIAVANEVEVLDGGQINSLSPEGIGAGGNISIEAQSLRVNGGGLFDENFVPTTQISTATGDLFLGGGSGRGGDLSIKVDTLDLANSAQISSASFGAGDAGNIEINASAVRVDAQFFTLAQISANTQQIEGGGNAGDIVIRSDSFEMHNGATLVASTYGSGQAGRVEIDADSILFQTGAILTAGTFGSGSGGSVQIRADRLRLDGIDTLTGGPGFVTGIQAITTSLDAPAPGGNIRVTAGSIEMDRMGSLFTTSYGLGSGGNIEVNADSLKLARGSSIRAEGLDAGPAGNIVINVERNISLTGRSAINTSALGSSGGDIRVTGGGNFHLSNSGITAQAGPGGGGNIELSGRALGYLFNSTLSAEAVGDGGNLTIDSDFFIQNTGALISRSSSANGGNITILANYFFQSESLLDASAPFGLPGTVRVTAPDLDLSGSLIALPGGLLDLENELRPDCRVRLAGDTSTFIMLGRGGLPIEPGGFVPSGLFLTPR